MDTSIAFAATIPLVTCLAAGIGIAYATAKATDGAARQPEAADSIQKILLLGAALVEATAIYGLVVALLLILVR